MATLTSLVAADLSESRDQHPTRKTISMQVDLFVSWGKSNNLKSILSFLQICTVIHLWKEHSELVQPPLN